MADSDCDVLITGAGPTGLVLALWLTRLGVRVRIVDRAAEPGTTSRAVAVQARTTELYRQLGLDQDLIARGHHTKAAHLWVRGRRVADIPFTEAGAGQSPAPFFLIYPQDEHERLLTARLAQAGVEVERPVELLNFTQDGGGVLARLRRADGEEEACRAAFIAGCDGARSVVRHAIGAEFPGGTYDRLFYVADVEAEGEAVNGDLNVDLDEADFVAVFPLAASGRVRLIGTVKQDRVGAQGLTFADVSDHALGRMDIRVRQVNWFSTYHVHHRVADRFRQGRAFILGDAAHIHSPVGGQGMNTGIGDAINLAWKLKAVLDGRAGLDFLDSYQVERQAFARRLVATTDRGFTFVTAEGPLADFVRTRVAPLVIPPLVRVAQEVLVRTAGQLNLNYREGPLSEGRAGEVHGGDRLPWVGDLDNFAPLNAMAWQAHVYGEAEGALRAACDRLGLPLHVFAWSAACEQAGLAQDAAYLIRPDGYVALALKDGAGEGLEAYFTSRRIRP